MKKFPKINLKNEDEKRKEKISKIKIEEALEDFDKVFKLIKDLDFENVEKIDFKYLTSQAKKFKKEFEEKYDTNLDSKK